MDLTIRLPLHGFIAVAVVILLAVAADLRRSAAHRRAVLSAKDTVVLADFANSTGDALFDECFVRAAIQLRHRLSSASSQTSVFPTRSA